MEGKEIKRGERRLAFLWWEFWRFVANLSYFSIALCRILVHSVQRGPAAAVVGGVGGGDVKGDSDDGDIFFLKNAKKIKIQEKRDYMSLIIYDGNYLAKIRN